jgi:dihydroorotate dehydrogenase (NAD+) catalytic subunit
VVGFGVGEFAAVIEQLELSLDDEARGALDGYEINVSCPNVKAGGMEFGADPAALADVVRLARAATGRPIFVKLSPALPDIARSASVAADAGANGLTLVNTIPGLVIDVERRRAVKLPLMGIGGVSTANDALQYLLAGATLVGMGTAMLRDPRAPERVVRELAEWCDRHGVQNIGEIVGTLEGLG